MSSLWKAEGEHYIWAPQSNFILLDCDAMGLVISSKESWVLRDCNETGFVYTSTLVYGVVSSRVLYPFIDGGVL
jgi:hypothetical protein